MNPITLFLNKYFIRNDYAVAVKFRGKNVNSIDVDGLGQGWHVVKNTHNNWFADPFVFEYQNRNWLFVEVMNRWKQLGSIAVAEIKKDGSVSKMKQVLAEPFHLSYPNVFHYDGNVYMIPESGLNNDIRLYVAIDFPYKWKFVKQLSVGRNFVDTSFVKWENKDVAIMNSFDWDSRQSHFFQFNLKDMSFNTLPSNALFNERCGGNCFEENGETYRVLQDCSTMYGEKLLFRRITNFGFEQGTACDEQYAELLPSQLSLVGINATRCHTYNRSRMVEVIDFNYLKFHFSGLIYSIHNKYLLLKYSN